MIGNAYSAFLSVTTACPLLWLTGTWKGETAGTVAFMALLQYALFRFWVWHDHERQETLRIDHTTTIVGPRKDIAAIKRAIQEHE